MAGGDMKFTPQRILFLIVATLLMWGALFLWNSYVHSPFLQARCVASCEKAGFRIQSLEKGYSGRKQVEKCMCVKPVETDRDFETKTGYFFVSIGYIDWFLLILFRLIPLGVLVFFSIFLMAKIVAKI